MAENDLMSQDVQEELQEADRQLLGLYGCTLAEPACDEKHTGLTVVARENGAIAGIVVVAIDIPCEEFLKLYPNESDVFVRTNMLKTTIRLTGAGDHDNMITVWDRDLVSDENIVEDLVGKFVMFSAQQEYYGLGRKKGENLIRLAHKMDGRNITFSDIVSSRSREEIEMDIKQHAAGIVVTRVMDWSLAIPLEEEPNE